MHKALGANAQNQDYGLASDRDHIFILNLLTCFISESRVFISTIRKMAEFIIRLCWRILTMADIEIRQASPTAFYIKVHDTDNVAIIVNDNGLKAGTRFPDGLELIEHIPQGHKVALVDIPATAKSCVTVKSSAMPFAYTAGKLD
jgi:hypothetical protein